MQKNVVIACNYVQISVSLRTKQVQKTVYLQQ